MPRYVALLRAINVGGAHIVKMDLLRQLFESLDFSGVETFIASGNVLFGTNSTNPKALERRIGKRLSEALGYEVGVFLRTVAELAEISNYQAFRKSEIDAAAALYIVFLADALDEKLKHKVAALTTGTDKFHVHEREIYWLRRKRPGAGDYPVVPLDKTLAGMFTIRNAKTVKKIAVKYSSTSMRSK